MPIDITEKTFESLVLQRSKEVPILVDFWAEWCSPCKMLSPILTKLEIEYKGRFILAKINTDQNQELAMVFKVSSIPAVKLVFDGKIIDEFVGALPEKQIRAFLDKNLPIANEKEEEKENKGDPIERAELALKADPKPDNLDKILWEATMQCLTSAKGDDLIRKYLMQIQEVGSEYSMNRNIIVSFLEKFTDANDRKQLQKLIQNHRDSSVLDYFLDKVAIAPTSDQKLIQKDGLLTCFQILGNSNPFTNEYRKKLASILF